MPVMNSTVTRRSTTLTIDLPTGELLHVHEDSHGEWVVFLDSQDAFKEECGGFCIGAGDNREAAIADALRVLEAATAALRGPASLVTIQ